MKQLKSTTLFTGMLIFGLSSHPYLATAAENAPAAESTQEMLSESFATISKTLERARDQVTQAVKQRDQALSQLASTRQENEKKDLQLAEFKKLLAESQKQNECWKEKAIAHEKAATEWKKAAEEQAQQLAIGSEAQQKLGIFRNRLDTTMKEFAALEGELANIRNELKTPREMVSLVKENGHLKAEAGKIQQNVVQLTTDNQKIQKDLAETRKELADAKQSLVAMNEGQQRSTQTAKAERANLETELAAAKTAADQARKQLAQAEQNRVNAEKSLHQERVNAAQKLEAAKKEIEQAGRQAEARNKELADAQAKLVGAMQIHKEISGVVEKRDKTIAELRQQLDSSAVQPAHKEKSEEEKQSADASR